MSKPKAFEIVLKNLCNVGMFTGKYDAKHGSKEFMDGIETVMEFIAYGIDEKAGEEFTEWFLENRTISEEKADGV